MNVRRHPDSAAGTCSFMWHHAWWGRQQGKLCLQVPVSGTMERHHGGGGPEEVGRHPGHGGRSAVLWNMRRHSWIRFAQNSRWAVRIFLFARNRLSQAQMEKLEAMIFGRLQLIFKHSRRRRRGKSRVQISSAPRKWHRKGTQMFHKTAHGLREVASRGQAARGAPALPSGET